MKILMTDDGVWVSQAVKSGYIFCEWGGCFDYSYPESKLRRGRSQGNGNLCPTLTTSPNIMVTVKEMKRIRRLTEKETWRLMAFDDEDYENAAKVVSSSQLYKQAGNSICVNVLEAIFGQMIEGKEDEWKERWG